MATSCSGGARGATATRAALRPPSGAARYRRSHADRVRATPALRSDARPRNLQPWPRQGCRRWPRWHETGAGRLPSTCQRWASCRAAKLAATRNAAAPATGERLRFPLGRRCMVHGVAEKWSATLSGRTVRIKPAIVKQHILGLSGLGYERGARPDLRHVRALVHGFANHVGELQCN